MQAQAVLERLCPHSDRIEGLLLQSVGLQAVVDKVKLQSVLANANLALSQSDLKALFSLFEYRDGKLYVDLLISQLRQRRRAQASRSWGSGGTAKHMDDSAFGEGVPYSSQTFFDSRH